MSAINTTDTDFSTPNYEKTSSLQEDNCSLLVKIEFLMSGMKTEILTEVNSLIENAKLNYNNTQPESQIAPSSENEVKGLSYSVVVASGDTITPESQQQLLFISAEENSNFSTSEVKDKVIELKKDIISKSLKDVPTNFIKANENKGSITVAFPDLKTREKASQLIGELDLSSAGFQTKEGKKLLPKLTIENVDATIIDGVMDNIPFEQKRGQQKELIKNSILSKNGCFKSLVDEGHTLEIVYLLKPDRNNFITIALKVSPSSLQ